MRLIYEGTLNTRAIFSPRSYSPALSERGSTATMVCDAGGPEIHDGDWILDDDLPGGRVIWRVKYQEEDRQTGAITYSLEHIVRTLADNILPGEYAPKDIVSGATTVTARQAASWVLGFHGLWTLGDFQYEMSAPFNFNRDSLFDALETISEALEGAIWEYDLTAIPFVLHIRNEDAQVACEMRWGRNLTGLRIRRDRSKMYTRIYPIGKDDLTPSGDGYYSRNEDVYGRIDHTETDTSIDSQALLESWARGKLAHHCVPVLTVTGTGLEISRATGEPLDNLVLNRVCRIPDPQNGYPVQARIRQLQWADFRERPEVVTITLSNEETDVARIVNSMAKSSGRGGRAGAKEAKEDHAWFVDTDEHVGMIAEGIIGRDPDGNPVDWSRVASIIVDGTGIHQRVVAAEGELVVQSARIDVTEGRITQEVTDRTNADGALSTSITQTATEIRATLANEIDGVEGTIVATANGLQTEFRAADDTLRSGIQQNATDITAEVTRATGAESALGGRIQVNADKVSMVVEETAGGNVIKAAEITAAINASTGQSEAWIKADKIWIGSEQKYLEHIDPDTGLRDDVLNDYDVAIAGKAYISDLTAAVARISTLEADIADLDYLKSQIGSIASLNVQTISSNRGNATFYGLYATNVLNVGSVDCSALPNGVKSIQVIETSSGSGVYKLQYTTYANPSTWTDAGTFSHAAAQSFTGAWSGSNTGDTATYTVTGSPGNISVASSAAKLHINRNAAWVTDPDGVIRARLDNDYYDLGEAAGEVTGWNDAYGKVNLPKTNQTTNAFIDIKTPSSVPGTADPDNTRYTVSVDASYAYIKWGGVIVAQVANPMWSTGYDDGWDAAVAKDTIPDSQHLLPTTTMQWPTGARGNWTNITYTVSADNNYAYLKHSNGTIVARATHQAYDNGWDAAVAKDTIPDSQHLLPTTTMQWPSGAKGNWTNITYTVSADDDYAYLKHSNGVIVARATHQAYAHGWTAAYGKNVIPDSQHLLPTTTMTWPASTTGDQDSVVYTVSADDDYAYLKHSNGVIVARATHQAYAHGWTAAYGKNLIPSSQHLLATTTMRWPSSGSSVASGEQTVVYTVSADDSYAYLKHSNGVIVARATHQAYDHGWEAAVDMVGLPAAGTATWMSVRTPSGARGNWIDTAYTVSTDNNYAYIKQGDTVVARCTNTKTGGPEQYYDSSYWQMATSETEWYARRPNRTNTAAENWNCGARTAYNVGANTAFIGNSSSTDVSGTTINLDYGETVELWPGAKNVSGTVVWPSADTRKVTITAPDAVISASDFSCSGNNRVQSIGTNYGNRLYCGAISKSGISARTYLGFTISVAGISRGCYITVNT